MKDEPAAPLAHAERGLTFALDLAMQMFRQGLETAGIARTVRVLADAEGLSDTRISIGARRIDVQYRASDSDRPLQLFAAIDANDARDIGRMADLESLATRVGRREIEPEQAESELTTLTNAGPTWPWYISVLGGCLLAAMICLQAGGTPLAAIISAALFVCANRIGWALSLIGIAEFFQVAAKAGVVLIVALGCLTLGLITDPEAASLAAANLALLLPILSLVSLVEDAVGNFHLMAAARLITVLLLTGAIITGVMAVVSVAQGMDVIGEASRVQLLPLPFWLVPVTALVGSLGNAILMGTPVRWWALAGFAGILTALVNWVGLHWLGLSPALAILLATTVLGMFAGSMLRARDVPTAAIAIPGLTGAVLPGPAMYTSLTHVFAELPGAWESVLAAVLSTAAIGIGVVLGMQLVAVHHTRANNTTLR